jgi:putative phosphoesterase
MLLGVISDTHGLLRPELLRALAAPGHRVDHILHAGDVGDPDILTQLSRIAPVTAIRGNIDTHGPCSRLPATESVELAGHLLYMLHSIDELDLHPHAAHISVVIFGHSHRHEICHHQDVLYLNPGSVGPRRFNLPITYALLRLQEGPPTAEIIHIPTT